jgi:DnaK suppressor protein
MPNNTRPSSQPGISPEEVRTLLERRRAQFLVRMSSDAAPAILSQEAEGQLRGPGDAGDRALRDLAEEDRLHDAQRASALVKLIDAALARLNAGTYGLCLDCGEPIAARRLRSIPEVLRCVNCQEMYDSDHPSGERHATL